MRDRIHGVLGSRFVGMYLYGSLALGGFDPQGSDIDFLVATDGELPREEFDALREMHRAFDESGSAWARRVEAAYIPVAVLQGADAGASVEAGAPVEAGTSKYPQIEKDQPLVLAPLEIGWPFQSHTLREYGVAIIGPDPRELVASVPPRAMREAAAAIVGDWLERSRQDPEWLAWLRDRSGQAFVTLTLCRLLYSLGTGSVTSKPKAARWAAAHGAEGGPGHGWASLIERSLALQYGHDETPESDVEETLALLRFTAGQLMNEK